MRPRVPPSLRAGAAAARRRGVPAIRATALRARRAEIPVRFRGPGEPTAVVGHKGAPAVAPANTAEGFLTAAELGADGIELDLIAVDRQSVIVAHDLSDATQRPDALPLDELTELLAEGPLASKPVLLDVKSLGTERAVAAAMVGARLTPRAIISTTDPHVLWRMRLAMPAATRSQTFPRSRRDPERSPLSQQLARLRRPVVRRVLPVIVRRAVQRHDLAAVTVHHLLVTAELRRVTRRLGVELIVWTVDDSADAERMLELDVDAIITNDPAVVLAARTRHTAAEQAAPGAAAVAPIR